MVAFNNFKSKFNALNLSLQPNSQYSESRLATIYTKVSSACGEKICTKIETRILIDQAHGDLDKTIAIIRLVLSDHKSDEITHHIEHARHCWRLFLR